MEDTHLRERALDAIDHEITWYPANSAKRIRSMVEGRPDWCLSRQRTWGVPIPSFTCADCGEKVMNDDTLDAVIKLFHEHGSDAWYTQDPASYLGDACVCPACGGHHLVPDKDILDVWWDSGVSHTAVLRYREELRFPADLYLEGSDQHRGWFQSSLLTSLGAYSCPPFKAVMTQGFTLDGQGRKMSKSLGNVIDPNTGADSMGADIIRLWVASTDTSQDMACDQDILSHVGDAYRRFRNTFRFLLGELEGQFDPATQALPLDELTSYDQLVLARATQVHQTVTKAYEQYRFNVVFRTLYDFVITELSNGYLNATKDRMYCDAATSKERLSAQTTWAELLSMLVRDLQPILAFTCDEVMAYLPASLREGKEYAALLSWYHAPYEDATRAADLESLLASYQALLEVRAAYTKAYDQAISDGTVSEKTTSATAARVSAPASIIEALTAAAAPNMAEVLVCSSVTFEPAEELSVAVTPATGEKCPRCWNWRELGEDGLCDRCHDVIAQQAAAEKSAE
jgi:isoleucyl-tRNA synthetase